MHLRQEVRDETADILETLPKGKKVIRVRFGNPGRRSGLGISGRCWPRDNSSSHKHLR